jgi:hypothetical protein
VTVDLVLKFEVTSAYHILHVYPQLMSAVPVSSWENSILLALLHLPASAHVAVCMYPQPSDLDQLSNAEISSSAGMPRSPNYTQRPVSSADAQHRRKGFPRLGRRRCRLARSERARPPVHTDDYPRPTRPPRCETPMGPLDHHGLHPRFNSSSHSRGVSCHSRCGYVSSTDTSPLCHLLATSSPVSPSPPAP